MRKIKIERINNKQKILLISSIIIIGIAVTLVLITSKAKYKNIESIDLASGTINYTPADIDILAIQIENESGKYESSTNIPSSDYVLSNDSYCNVNGEKDPSIKITYENGKIAVNDISKKIKCYLYFDKKVSAINKIIGDTAGIVEKTEFTGQATSADTGIYSAPDDYGTSYYFRGLEGSLNNWVKFANSYWRIIRVNGNGTIRMIYSGTASETVSNNNKNGVTTLINETTYNFNGVSNDNTYVGYMKTLNNSGNTTSSNGHQNNYDSNAKSEVDKWYQNNIGNNENYAKHVDVNTGFCNDRQTMSGVYPNIGTSGYGTNNTSYAPWGRLFKNGGYKPIQTPTLQCENKTRDLFTVNNTNTENKGNKKLTYPVGLITSDEVVFAGGYGGAQNTTFYLYNNQNYWTMSPYFCAPGAQVFYVSSTKNSLESYSTHWAGAGLRPVINLKSDTKLTYNNETTKGSETDPFIVI